MVYDLSLKTYSADKVNLLTSIHVKCGQSGVDRGVERIPRLGCVS